MKNMISIAVLGLVLGLPLSVNAMTLTDVMQQHAIYKSSPSVLGASTTAGVPAGSLSQEQSTVLLQGLKYAKKSNTIVSGTLKSGMTGSDEVKTLQLFLVAKGYLSADPTGYYGAKTKAAVKKFQADNGIVSDGSIVGPATRAAITQWVASATR